MQSSVESYLSELRGPVTPFSGPASLMVSSIQNFIVSFDSLILQAIDIIICKTAYFFN